MKEKEIISMQDSEWLKARKLFIVLVGSSWKAYNDSAKVISSITGYRLRRKTVKSSIVDLVSFPSRAMKNVKRKLSSEGCIVFDEEHNIVSYKWHKSIPDVQVFHPVKTKYYRQEFRYDTETKTSLRHIISNGGFCGRERATASEILRYAIRHFYDNKPVSLEEADKLIWAISNNRKSLDSALYNLRSVVEQIRAIGININQIAHRINYLENKAEDEGYDVSKRAENLAAFRNEVMDYMYSLAEAEKKLEPILAPAVSVVKSALDKENEFMNRVLI